VTATFEVEREFISWRTLVLPSKKSFKSSRFSTTEKTSLKKQGKRIWRKKNKKVFYIFSDLWPSLEGGAPWPCFTWLLWSEVPQVWKNLVFFGKKFEFSKKMENRNTRLGGVSRRRALGDLTSQLNNRPANFQNQDTLQPIKPQVRIFGFRTLTFWICGRFWAIFGTLWSIDHCDWKILPPADALCSSIQSKGRPMNWFNGTFFIRFDVVIDLIE